MFVKFYLNLFLFGKRTKCTLVIVVASITMVHYITLFVAFVAIPFSFVNLFWVTFHEQMWVVAVGLDRGGMVALFAGIEGFTHIAMAHEPRRPPLSANITKPK